MSISKQEKVSAVEVNVIEGGFRIFVEKSTFAVDDKTGETIGLPSTHRTSFDLTGDQAAAVQAFIESLGVSV